MHEGGAKLYKTSDYLIAYFDILGYQAIVQNGIIKESIFIEAIKTAVMSVKSAKVLTDSIKTYCFSDNFVICIPITNNAEIAFYLEKLIFILHLIVNTLLTNYGIFIRGSIVCGDLYTEKNFIYGNGLIKAYKLEDEVAIFPRIVVEHELVDELICGAISLRNRVSPNSEIVICENNMFYNIVKFSYEGVGRNPPSDIIDLKHIKIKKDFDGVYFVDILSPFFICGDSLSLTPIDLLSADTDLIHSIDQNLWVICARVIKAMSLTKEKKVLVKYLWFCLYINSFYEEKKMSPPFTKKVIQELAGIDIGDKIYEEIDLNLIP